MVLLPTKKLPADFIIGTENGETLKAEFAIKY